MKASQTVKTLKKFGLSENEIAVYLECLKEEDLTPYRISRLTKIPRTTVYDVLMDLSLKGLVELQQSDGFTKQQTLVKAKNPSALRNVLRQKRKDLLSLEIDIIDILPQLKGDYHEKQANADFKFYPGIEGARKMLYNEEIAEIDLPVYIWTDRMPVDIFGYEKLDPIISRWTRLMEKHKRKSKEIIFLGDWTRHVLSYQLERDPDFLKTREFRYPDYPDTNIAQQIIIKGNHVGMACVHEEEVWGLHITSPALAHSLTTIFNAQWMSSNPLTPEIIRSWGPSEYLKAQIKKGQIKKKKY
ncbi:helix-turn-helix domain-containing protein [Candidatus Dojkabacteria bacterium]|nr:helix-turn-helix domain-containing protein [Candidatus Dojkabacteria bacterium]